MELTDGHQESVGVGKWSAPVTVRVEPSGSSTLALAYGAPRLPVRGFTLYRVGPGRLRLGPLIGVLVMYRVSRRGPRGSQMATYRELMHRAREVGGLVFVMRAATLRGRSRRVLGWTFVNGRWIQCRLPYPDVVYNRIPSRPVERRVRRS